ncbi:hypothetical protein HS088_TW14G00527 [Tripterygium wilfordii]|uniref:Uncharacterized protein n=1 Tax=Tripterygium wilfordii TaxID=458696 RepID=A0A7J7CQJ4_TRIWF|nr:uncharacterized protein LOC120014924 [Tripterygium wilfordii]KAF5736385.1 hypothetical protein HS088_TW14G00527 [Tripterygium wilfordii]
MESENGSNSSKPRYDITMSKRTRKPSNLNTILPTESESPVKDVLDEEDRESIDRESDRKSLEHLIKSRSSLGEHFTQEETQQQQQLQLVKKNQEDKKGLKLRGMVTHCTKVLSHLIKLKRDPARLGSRKKPILRLPS